MNTLQRKIGSINSYRSEVLDVLEKASLVHQQKLMVEETLAKNPDFKIAGYFLQLLTKLKIRDKEDGAMDINTTDLEENYRKSELNAKFGNMTMKELTELLQEIEKNPRIATDRIDITKSKNKPKTIDVNLTISTLLPKIESTSI